MGYATAFWHNMASFLLAFLNQVNFNVYSTILFDNFYFSLYVETFSYNEQILDSKH